MPPQLAKIELQSHVLDAMRMLIEYVCPQSDEGTYAPTSGYRFLPAYCPMYTYEKPTPP